jgi:hypothetical protein
MRMAVDMDRPSEGRGGHNLAHWGRGAHAEAEG